MSSGENKAVTAGEFLERGLRHMDDRAATYDSPQGERSMQKTVSMFNILADTKITEEQGWLFMTLLKTVRCQQGNFKEDNY